MTLISKVKFKEILCLQALWGWVVSFVILEKSFRRIALGLLS